ncbi:MAG: S-layer protein [Methanospirillum sp.]|nr:S-layer protein [Methanospirillum sp.]
MQTSVSLRAAVGCAVAALLIAAVIVSPVAAGAKYTSGGPVLSASIAGSNEVPAGQTVPLNVVVQNSGLIDSKMVGTTIVERTDLPNTAKSLTVGLGGASGIAVESDPQMVGDIPGGAAAPATFMVRIPSGTPAGTYTLPLALTYTHLASAEQIGGDSINYQYREVRETIPLALTVKPEAVLEVVNVTTESLNVGTEGYLNLTVKNAGAEPATNAIVRVARNGQSPVTPVDSSVFVGAFAPGQTVHLRYRVAVSSEAGAQSYPLDIMVSYDDTDGINRTGRPVTIGVPVGGKIGFAVVSAPASVAAGEKAVLEVVYRNTGAAPVAAAQARLSAVDPFTSSDDTAFLGDMEPGEEKAARFEVSVDAGATAKEYGLDSEVRYRDALDNSQISDTMKVSVTVTPGGSLLGSPLVLALIAALLIGGGYVVYRRRKGSA